MSLRLEDLPRNQRELLDRLHDDFAYEDSVGVRDVDLINFSPDDLGDLLRLALIDLHWGWQNSAWLRMTERGWQLKKAGSVE